MHKLHVGNRIKVTGKILLSDGNPGEYSVLSSGEYVVASIGTRSDKTTYTLSTPGMKHIVTDASSLDAWLVTAIPNRDKVEILA